MKGSFSEADAVVDACADLRCGGGLFDAQAAREAAVVTQIMSISNVKEASCTAMRQCAAY